MSNFVGVVENINPGENLRRISQKEYGRAIPFPDDYSIDNIYVIWDMK
jgi:hypothetical protein